MQGYPLGRKVRSLSARGPFDSLIFFRILLLIPETFFLFGSWMVEEVDGGWHQTFWFFKSLDNNMVYTLGIYIHVYI